MWRSNFTNSAQFCRLHLLHIPGIRLHLPPTFAANIAAYSCRIHLPHKFAAYICRIHLPHTFAAYILEVCLHFEQAPIFYACVYILGKCQYFDDFLQ
jgi:hypothetical protein